MTDSAELPPRSALYLPASNARAIAKARTLDCDMVILDLEDAVSPENKALARDQAVAAMAEGFGERLTAIRLNGAGSDWHAADIAAVRGSAARYFVLPKVENARDFAAVADAVGKPGLAMIESPCAILDVASIAAAPGLAGLIIGTNDLAADLRLPLHYSRAALSMSLQLLVLAARAHRLWALDGVFNALDDAAGLAAECLDGRGLGYDGKTLIHPNQIAAANQAFAPSAAEIDEARALIAAAQGGAQRFRDRMIETLHVKAAKRLLARA